MYRGQNSYETLCRKDCWLHWLIVHIGSNYLLHLCKGNPNSFVSNIQGIIWFGVKRPWQQTLISNFRKQFPKLTFIFGILGVICIFLLCLLLGFWRNVWWKERWGSLDELPEWKTVRLLKRHPTRKTPWKTFMGKEMAQQWQMRYLKMF